MEATGIIVAVVGLLITVVVVAGVFFTLYKVFGGLKQQSQERDRLLREGIQASARVVGVQMGGMTMTVGVHRHLQLHINLEVYPQGGAPYAATLTTMVSELQIPQIQPGVTLTVRYDANNPMKLALEGVGAAGPTQVGAHPQHAHHGYAAQPAYSPPGGPGYPGQPYAAPAGGMVPVQGVPGMPKGAKIGLVIGLLGAVVGVGVAVVVVAVNVLGASNVALASSDDSNESTSSSGVCTQAARCCETIGAPASACANFEKVSMPDSACTSALDGYKKAAAAQGKSCD